MKTCRFHGKICTSFFLYTGNERVNTVLFLYASFVLITFNTKRMNIATINKLR